MSIEQSPHALRHEGERRLEVAIEREIREVRKQLGITVAESTFVSRVWRDNSHKPHLVKSLGFNLVHR